jgi:hypothetical protein
VREFDHSESKKEHFKKNFPFVLHAFFYFWCFILAATQTDASTFCFYHSVTSAYHKLYKLKKTRSSKKKEKKKKKHGFSKVRPVRKILYIYA